MFAILCDRKQKSRKMIEKKIGEKIRELRKKKGLSQIELANRIGISFQQIQKYEKGLSKISISRLYQISDALGVDINYFFQENLLAKEHFQEYHLDKEKWRLKKG